MKPPSRWPKILIPLRTERGVLLVVLVFLGIILTATIVRGVFIIDEDNYLVNVVGLRHGQLSAPGTEGLTPSRELVYFDPEARRRVVQSTPVVSLAPPLYAFVALPFSYAGWRGLVFLNTLSFLIGIYLVFLYVRSLTRQSASAWIACALFALGGYCVEYAQGMWPEMLSVVLCTGTLFLCLEARRNLSTMSAFFGGMLVGLATGVREQNIFFAGCVGLGLLLFGKRRIRSAAAFGAGVVLLLVVIATLNYYRLGIWHPFPKVAGYTQEVAVATQSGPFLEPLRVFWAKVVDYSSYGPNTAHIRTGYYQWDASSGTTLMNGIVKKSWIQSSPWIGLALIALVLIWFRPRTDAADRANELKILGLIVVPTLLMFSAAGFDRTDGLSFNQRYFLELLPLCAVATALYLDSVKLSALLIAVGFAVGTIIVGGILVLPTETMRHIGERYTPLLLALALAIVWYVVKSPRAVAVLLGMCIGWAFLFHIESDLVGSRFRRNVNAKTLTLLEKVIPDHSALFTYWGDKDAAGPLQLGKDVVILDTWADGGKDARALEKELEARKRSISVLENDMPAQILDALKAARRCETVSEGNLRVTKILDEGGSDAAH